MPDKFAVNDWVVNESIFTDPAPLLEMVRLSVLSLAEVMLPAPDNSSPINIFNGQIEINRFGRDNIFLPIVILIADY